MRIDETRNGRYASGVDDDLMNELEAIQQAVEPTDRLYVADAMTGQDAIKSAGEFNRRIGISGVVLSKISNTALLAAE